MSTAPAIVTPADLPPPYSGPPLRIAYVGNFRHSWCTEVHVAASLEQLGHEVLRWQEDQLDWAFVPKAADAESVQLLLWTRTWPAELETVVPQLDALRQLGIPSVSYHLDRWWGLEREHQVHDQPFFHTDLVVSPDASPRWADAGVNHLWLPPGVFGPECDQIDPNPRRWPYDVVFVGSVPYPHPEWAPYRQQLLGAFRRAFGGRFGVLPRKGQPVRGRDLQELYATVPVVLGDSCLAGESNRYWSDRVPETLGRGGLLIHPEVPGMEAWYSGQRWEHGSGDLHPYAEGLSWPPDSWGDLLTYRLGDFAQAADLAKWALAHPDSAAAIKANGQDTATNRDSYAHRLATVLAVAAGIHGGYRDVTPQPPSVDALVRNLEESLAAARGSVPVPVWLNRWSAIFDPRPGTTDSEVIGEVWRNDYRVPPEGFSGTVVDIGANVGAFSVLAAKAGSKRVVAFEPESANLNRLVHHMDLNGVAHRIVAYGEAVTGLGLPVVTVNTGGGARVEPASDPWDDTVQSLTLAALLDGFGPVELLKMDIEGGEYEAFAACPASALALVERIALEFHGPAMPHLTHLDEDGKHLERWGALVAKLADAGRVETFGHPMRGGLIWWKRY
jgi:FkbM family methyltransferase